MANEYGSAVERIGIDVGLGVREAGRHQTDFRVEKWDLDQISWTAYKNQRDLKFNPGQEPDQHWFRAFGCAPDSVYFKEDCNLITDLGWQYIMNGFAGAGITKFVNATNGRIGLGTDATVAAYGDTHLTAIGALTNANWELINAVPTVGATHTAGLVLAAQFPTTDANGVAIQEFATDLGTVATLSTAAVGVFVTHGNATPGTKTAAQTWNATVTITWT